MQAHAPAAAASLSLTSLRRVVIKVFRSRGLRALIKSKPGHNVCELCKMWDAQSKLLHIRIVRAQQQLGSLPGVPPPCRGGFIFIFVCICVFIVVCIIFVIFVFIYVCICVSIVVCVCVIFFYLLCIVVAGPLFGHRTRGGAGRGGGAAQPRVGSGTSQPRGGGFHVGRLPCVGGARAACYSARTRAL